MRDYLEENVHLYGFRKVTSEATNISWNNIISDMENTKTMLDKIAENDADFIEKICTLERMQIRQKRNLEKIVEKYQEIPIKSQRKKSKRSLLYEENE